MSCNNCHETGEEKPAVRAWTALPVIDLENVPADLDLICGSDDQMQSWRIPLSYIVELVKKELGNGS
jgi:hypothetical protein